MNKYVLLTIFVCSASVIPTDGIEVLNKLAVDDLRAELLTVIDKTVRSLMTSPSVQAFFKTKCAKNKQVDASEKTQEATDNLMDCISTVMDSGALSNLTFKRSMDKDKVLFGRFCSKSETLVGCVRDFASTVDVCFDKGDNSENNSGTIIRRIMEAWLLFSCGGNTLLSYVKKLGSECVASKQMALSRCSEPITTFMEGSGKFSHRFPSVLFEKEQCGMLSNSRQCVVDELNKCDRPLAAVQYYTSLFDVVRDMSPCQSGTIAAAARSSSTSDLILNLQESDSTLSTVFLPVISMLTFIVSGIKYMERLVMPAGTALMPA